MGQWRLSETRSAAGAAADMNVFVFLRPDGGFPGEGVAAGRLVIVAEKHPRAVGQGQEGLDRVIKLAGVAARKVAARGAKIGHEQGVADK